MKDDIETVLSRLFYSTLKVIDPGLHRVENFLEFLGSPHKHLPPVIHVAGTNGKGSLIAYLHAIFEAAGYSVNRYTSPHLIKFNERIVISGTPIDDDYFRNLPPSIMDYMEKNPVTFFEATTAVAFLAFAQHPADILLLETGMGGRLDATNVIDKPLITAITPVSFDHQSFLGNTIKEIAGEKAGIIKRDVPCVVGRQEPEAAEVIAHKAESMNSLLYRLGNEWQVLLENDKVTYQSRKRTIQIRPSLAGAHQYDNAATAVACIDLLSSFSINQSHIEQGLERAVWPARLQHMTGGNYVKMLPAGIELWLDGGHNPHGAVALARWLGDSKIKDIYVICGMIRGKDEREFMSILAPYVTQLYTIAIPDEPQSLPAEQLEMAAKWAGIKTESADSIEKALQTIAGRAKTPSIVCICGSLYLAGKVLAANGKYEGI